MLGFFELSFTWIRQWLREQGGAVWLGLLGGLENRVRVVIGGVACEALSPWD